MLIKQLCDECIGKYNEVAGLFPSNFSEIKIYTLKRTKGVCPICENTNTFYVGELFIEGTPLENPLRIRKLSEREIMELPIALQCCYYLIGWNKSSSIKSVQDWINNFYHYYMDEDYPLDRVEERAERKCRAEISRLIEFANNIYYKGKSDGREEVINDITRIIKK